MRYTDPFTDFGFKKLFGQADSKVLLIDFLNQLLPAHHHVSDLSFKSPEQLGRSSYDRRAVYDLHCVSSSGEQFIVEMQKVKQKNFINRSLFYATFPIQQQALQGEWNFALKTVYCIALMDFLFEEPQAKSNRLVHHCLIKNQDCIALTDKLQFIFLELPKFDKPVEVLHTHFDKWVYLIKHLGELEAMPAELNEHPFPQAFAQAELSALSSAEAEAYRDSLKVYRDNLNIANTRFEEGQMDGMIKGEIKGKLEGKLEEKRNTARLMLAEGDAFEKIMRITGLSRDDLDQL